MLFRSGVERLKVDREDPRAASNYHIVGGDSGSVEISRHRAHKDKCQVTVLRRKSAELAFKSSASPIPARRN